MPVPPPDSPVVQLAHPRIVCSLIPGSCSSTARLGLHSYTIRGSEAETPRFEAAGPAVSVRLLGRSDNLNQVSEVVVRPAQDEDIDAVGTLLGQAFAGDSYTRVLFGNVDDAADRASDFFSHEIRTQYLPFGAVDIAEIDGQLAGVALWTRPDHPSGILHELRTLPGYLRRLGRRTPRAMISGWQSAKHHPPFPHWYLYLLGVSPDFQGRGIGGALLDYRLACFGPNDAAYLEATTPGSARLYARYGFVSLGEVPLTQGRTMLGMWRPAQPGPQPKD